MGRCHSPRLPTGRITWNFKQTSSRSTTTPPQKKMATISSSCSSSYYMKSTIPSSGRRLKYSYSGASVRALPIRILTVGKKRSKGIQLIVEEYEEKLKNYCSIDDVQIKSNPKNTSDVRAQIEGEDNVIIQHIRSEDWVVMLDERGLDIGSEQMAELVGDAGKMGSSAIAFCIGGPYGHGPQLRERADVTIRLSSMVLNHQIALIVLLEQLYRAWTILKGQKYHH